MAGTSDDSAADSRLAECLTEVAVAASTAILAVDFRHASTRLKEDSSPVSRADEAAQAAILEALARIAPGIPTISEEAVAASEGGTLPDEFFLIDPLDGTVEFLAGRLEYTVNVALVRGGTPVVGVIAAPGLGLLWRGAVGHGAQRLRFSAGEPLGAAERIRTRSWPAGERIAAVSRSHFDPASEAFLERVAPARPFPAGSALKFCRLAEGAVDVYPRLAPTSEWDVAAGHAVVAAAGGLVLAPDGRALHYGNGGNAFRVRGFIAWGDPAAARQFSASA